MPPPPPPNLVPPGCELNLAGTYKLQDDATFRYDVTDDGTAIHVHAFHQFGETRKDINSPAAEFELRRTPEGIHGSATTQSKTLSGAKTCEVLFPYEFTACVGNTVTFRTVQQVKLGEDCKPQDPLHPDFVEHVLVRLPASDAGAQTPPTMVDAGSPPVPSDAGAPIAAPLDARSVDAGSRIPLDAGALIDAGDQSATTLEEARLRWEARRLDAGVVTQSVDSGSPSGTAP